MQPFPHPSDATNKIWSRLANWFQRYSSLKYYKLTLWAFRSDELTTKKRWRHCFPHYKSMGAFCWHGNQSFGPICPKTLCSLSPTPVMLHIKFEDWPTGFRDIQVWKCGWRRTTTDHWYTLSSPCELITDRQEFYPRIVIYIYIHTLLIYCHCPERTGAVHVNGTCM